MKRSVRFCCLLVVIALACSTAPVSTAQVSVGTLLGGTPSVPVAYVVMDNGDIYRSGFGPMTPNGGFTQGPWEYYCNLFTTGGPASRVVGLCDDYVITAAGGVYRISQSPYCAIFDGLVGQPANQQIVATGPNRSVNGRYVYVVTDAGHVYRASNIAGWEFAGLLPIGPTPNQPGSWGAIKSTYR